MPEGSRLESLRNIATRTVYRILGRPSSPIQQEATPLKQEQTVQLPPPDYPLDSPYADFIRERQSRVPEYSLDLIANEMTELYRDFITFISDPASGIPPSERANTIQRLNNVDKEFIAELSHKMMQRYLGDQELRVVQDRVGKGQSQGPLDLKIVLANQLAAHMRDLIGKEKAQKLKQQGHG